MTEKLLEDEKILKALEEVAWNPHPNDLEKESEKSHALASKLSEHVYSEMARFATIIIAGSSAGIFFTVSLIEKLAHSDFVSTIFASLCAFSLSAVGGSFSLFKIVGLRRIQGEWYDRFGYQVGCSARLYSLPRLNEGANEIENGIRLENGLQELKRMKAFKDEADVLDKKIDRESFSIGMISLLSLFLITFGILNPIYVILFEPIITFFPSKLQLIIEAF